MIMSWYDYMTFKKGWLYMIIIYWTHSSTQTPQQLKRYCRNTGSQHIYKGVPSAHQLNTVYIYKLIYKPMTWCIMIHLPEIHRNPS